MTETADQSPRTLRIQDLGQIDYAAAHELQRRVAEDVEGDAGRLGVLFVCEHSPVLTVARMADPADLGRSVADWEREGVQVVETNRGGKITYHGPGQIVIYPVIRLREMGLDLHRYIRLLEETGIRFLSTYGVGARRDPAHTGVWVGDAKIAAIGVHVRRWIATHGMAININNPSDIFRRFTPCGIHDKGVVSLSELLGGDVDLADAKRRLVSAFGQVFSVTLQP